VLLGVLLPNANRNPSGRAIRETAAWARELGFDSVWAGDHIVMPNQVDSDYLRSPDHRWPFTPDADWYDPLLSLAWAATAAPDIQLGTSVVVLPLRHPIALAKQVASLSALTGRQLLLGVGVGWMREEFDALGMEFERRGRRAEEMVEVMRRLWTGGPVSFHGEFFGFDGLSQHPIPAKPPLILWGGNSRASMRHVARTGDGWQPNRVIRSEFQSVRAELAEMCVQAGRNVNSLTICAFHGGGRTLTAADYRWYADQGVQHLVTVPSSDHHGALADMKRMAVEFGLRPT
jgi:probable F420-dependent oxidoreductase